MADLGKIKVELVDSAYGELAVSLLANVAREYFHALVAPVFGKEAFPIEIADKLVTDFMVAYHREIFGAVSERRYRQMMDDNEELPF